MDRARDTAERVELLLCRLVLVVVVRLGVVVVVVDDGGGGGGRHVEGAAGLGARALDGGRGDVGLGQHVVVEASGVTHGNEGSPPCRREKGEGGSSVVC